MTRKLLTDFEWDSDVVHTSNQGEVETMDFFSPLLVIIIVLSIVATVVAFIACICCCICKRRSYQGTVYRQAPQNTTITTFPQASYPPATYPPAQSQTHYPGAMPASAPYFPQQVVYPPQHSYQQGPYYTAQSQPLMTAGSGYPPQEMKKEYDEAPPPYYEAMKTKASAPPPE